MHILNQAKIGLWDFNFTKKIEHNQIPRGSLRARIYKNEYGSGLRVKSSPLKMYSKFESINSSAVFLYNPATCILKNKSR